MEPVRTRSNADWSLAAIYATTVLARTMVITLIPVLAYRAFGSAQQVSELYFVASLFGVAFSVALPRLLTRLGRETILFGAALSGSASAVALSSDSPPGLLLGLILHVVMVLAFENVMSLYVMQRVPRRALATFEPLRIFLAGLSYSAGPWLGIALAQSFAPVVPLAVSAAAALSAPLLLRGQARSPGPAAAEAVVPKAADIVAFWAQPRLRLSWLLTAIRAGWWAMYIVYVPIFAIRYGLGAGVGGALVSFGSAFLLLSPAWGRLARRVGTRRVLMAGYAICGGFSILATGVAFHSAQAAAAILLAAALAMSAIDGMGNVTFLRAVRVHQRTRMTPIFSTYRDVSQIVAAGVFALLLLALPLPSVFLVAGVTLLAGTILCRHLPRRL